MAEIGVSVNDKEARSFLARQHKYLLDVLNLDELKIQLYTDEVLDQNIQEKLMNTALERRTKLQELLHYLGRQGEPGLLALIAALRNCTGDPTQVQLAASLEQKYEKFHENPHRGSSCSTPSIPSSSYSTDGPARQHHQASEQFPIHVVRSVLLPSMQMGVIQHFKAAPTLFPVLLSGTFACGYVVHL